MNRTQRRQLERSQGHRGSKAKRQGRPRPDRGPQQVGELQIAPADPEKAAEMTAAYADHVARQNARTTGLVVPPSAQEREALRHKGHQVPLTDSGLILPSGG